jgi:hypothetical protein
MKTTYLAIAAAITVSATVAATGCDKKDEPKPTLATATAPVVAAPTVTALPTATASATAVAATEEDPVTEEDFEDELDDISLTSMEAELAKIEKDLK